MCCDLVFLSTSWAYTTIVLLITPITLVLLQTTAYRTKLKLLQIADAAESIFIQDLYVQISQNYNQMLIVYSHFEDLRAGHTSMFSFNASNWFAPGVNTRHYDLPWQSHSLVRLVPPRRGLFCVFVTFRLGEK